MAAESTLRQRGAASASPAAAPAASKTASNNEVSEVFIPPAFTVKDLLGECLCVRVCVVQVPVSLYLSSSRWNRPFFHRTTCPRAPSLLSLSLCSGEICPIPPPPPPLPGLSIARPPSSHPPFTSPQILGEAGTATGRRGLCRGPWARTTMSLRGKRRVARTAEKGERERA